MEFAQESIATLHDFGAADPSGPVDRASILVPMIGREQGTAAAERLFRGLESVDPYEVIVPLRAPPARAAAVAEWLETYDIPVRILWCSGQRVADQLDAAGLHFDGPGKGRDMWIGMGAARGDYLAFHDADAATYEPSDTYRLLAPFKMGLEGGTPSGATSGFSFVKGYYARVENDRLYGRLTRLLYGPLIEAISAEVSADILTYLGAFRYALAGESAMTADLARSVRTDPGWGFEVTMLGEVFQRTGMSETAQVDLGRYEHEHRSVEGPGGLSQVSNGVADALFRVLSDAEIDVPYDELPARYRRTAYRRIRAYAADSAFNQLRYDPNDERRQVDTYAQAVRPPGPADRLPAWDDVDLPSNEIVRSARADLEGARDGSLDVNAPANPES